MWIKNIKVKKFLIIIFIGFLAFLLFFAFNENSKNDLSYLQDNVVNNKNNEITIRIITTSDMHGKMVPFDYIKNEESLSGSLAQVVSVIEKYRNDNTIVVDVGDVIQDNYAELFLDEEIHPMIQGMNYVGYDVCTLGNHEFNFGMDIVKKTIATHKAKVVLSNVYDKNGDRLASPYIIVEKSGLKVGVIGVVTPNILNWDRNNLVGYTVTNPIDEVNNAIKEIEDKTDVIIVLAHMGEENELDTLGSGVSELAKECKGIDFICAGHGHIEVVGKSVNGCSFVENLVMGQTVIVSDIILKKKNRNWQIENIMSNSIKTKDYEADNDILNLLSHYDKKAKNECNKEIGQLIGGDLVEKDEVEGITRALIEDTALMDLINEVMLYYSKADVSAIALSHLEANKTEGSITKNSVKNIYKYDANIYKLKMTGEQLKKWMEWSANFYKQTKAGDFTIAFDEDKVYFLYDCFEGVNYEINISKPKGERIENLTWPDGRVVKDDDVFTVTANDYRVNSALLVPGEIYDTVEEMPIVLDKMIREDIGNIYMLIIDYIKNVKDGVIIPKKNDNWKITGFVKDKEKQKEINEFVKSGKIKLADSENVRVKNTIPVTQEMIEAAKKG